MDKIFSIVDLLNKDKKILGIISDADHYYDHNGNLCTYPLLAKQFDSIAKNYHKVIICTPCLYNGLPGEIFSNYKQKNISVMPVPFGGGNSLFKKFILFFKMLHWYRVLRKMCKIVDILHIRFPDNIGLLGILLAYMYKIPSFGIYTGTWSDYRSEPWTYKLIKFIIKTFANFPVGIYSTTLNSSEILFKNVSPSYYKEEIDDEKKTIIKKINNIKNNSTNHLVLLTVGSLTRNKNQIYILKFLKFLAHKNPNFFLHIVGDGNQKYYLYNYCKKNNLLNNVLFHGNINHEKLRSIYRISDFSIQSLSQKVLVKFHWNHSFMV